MLEYTASTAKGQTAQGDVFNNPFALKNMDSAYTGSKVVENITSTAAAMALVWGPVARGAFETVTVSGVTYDVATLGIKVNEAPYAGVAHVKYDVKIVAPDGTVTYANLDNDGKVPAASLVANGKVAYCYDNVQIPANDIPTINVEMKGIALFAKARRIAIHYSSIAAFQAKQDYGFDMAGGLEDQAVGRLQYEIDTEVVELLDNVAGTELSTLVWSKTLPVGVNKKDHYAGFAEIVELANVELYNRTQRFAATWMIIASDIKPILVMMDGFKAASTSNINGPYFCGTLNGIKVYVSPAFTAGRYVLGVNGNDYQSAVAVYAPYMPVIPTMLIEMPDGSNNQGFATMYDLKVLNPALCVAGKVTA